MEAIGQLKLFCEQIGCACAAQEPMSRHTTFEIGGPADLFAWPNGPEMAAKLICKAKELSIPISIVGKGSDLLVSDSGVRGLVLSLTDQAAPVLIDDVTIECPAGVSLSDLCRFARDNALTGLEFAYGIPGSVGGAIYMNAGAYQGEMRDVVCGVHYLDENGSMSFLEKEQLAFGYRTSWFSSHRNCLITAARFVLQKGDTQKIQARMEELMQARRTKQPLEYPSAGSTFKRPQRAYASALIDSCGLKGRRVGGAMVSEKHAGFVINCGGATCADVKALIGEIQREVKEKTGFVLECEVQFLGD